MSKNKNTFVYQGAILAITSIIVRIIGFFYRIPMYHIIGEEGMGYYSSAFQVYAFLLMISSFGVPVAMSKLISNEIALKREGNIKIIFRTVLAFSAAVGLILATLLYLFAEQISLLTTKNTGITIALQTLAPALFILAILSVFRGYFQGFKTMVPTALSQLVEQVFNAIFSVLLVYLLFKKGLEYGAAGGTLGTGIGAGFALLLMLGLYYVAENGKRRKKRGDEMTVKEVLKLLLATMLPMIVSITIYNLPTIVDMIFFQRGLAYHGITKDVYTSLYGLFSTKFLMLIAVPISMASVFAVSSLPSLTASYARGNKRALRAKSNLAIKLCFLISLPAIVGLMVLGQPIIYLFFKDVNLEYASNIMIIGAGTIILTTLSSISTSILQSMDKMMQPVYNALIAMALKILCLIVFIYVINLSLYGVLISMYVFGIVSVLLNFLSIKKVINLRMNYLNTIIKPLLASLIMGGLAAGTYYLVGIIFKTNTVALVAAILLSVLAYFFMVLKLKTLNKKELGTLGGLGKLAMRFM